MVVTKLKKEYNEDNERLNKFIDLYIDYDGDNTRAWVDAGYAESGKSGSMAKLRQHGDVVERRIVERIGSHVPKALAVVMDLMENASQASVRLKAAQDILGRAGYDQASKIEFTEKKAEDLTGEELKSELKELLARADINEEAG